MSTLNRVEARGLYFELFTVACKLQKVIKHRVRSACITIVMYQGKPLTDTLELQEYSTRYIKSKCIPVLLYGLVACPLNKTQLSSLDFAINRFLMKLFSTINMEIITYCREQFDFELSSVILTHHTSLFLDKLRHCDNCLIKNVIYT